MTQTDWRSIPALKPALKLVRKIRFRPLHRAEAPRALREHGTDYGSWPVIKGSLGPESVVYSFGVGEDLSFDLEATALYGCAIDAFDPTPRSLDWVARQDLPATIRVHPYGLAGSSRILRFSPPANEAHVSYFAQDEGSEAGEMIELPVHPLDWFMKELGHTRVDYLKMDIEGSEYEVIADLAKKSLTPTQLCIEFHHGMYSYTDADTNTAVDQLKALGYSLHFVSDSGREYGFHRPDLMA